MKRKNEKKNTVGDRMKSWRNKIKQRRASIETSVSRLWHCFPLCPRSAAEEKQSRFKHPTGRGRKQIQAGSTGVLTIPRTQINDQRARRNWQDAINQCGCPFPVSVITVRTVSHWSRCRVPNATWQLTHSIVIRAFWYTTDWLRRGLFGEGILNGMPTVNLHAAFQEQPTVEGFDGWGSSNCDLSAKCSLSHA